MNKPEALASSMLSFLIVSENARLCQVVAAYAVSGLTTEYLNKCKTEVVAMLNRCGFIVEVEVSDNHAINRKGFREMAQKESEEQFIKEAVCVYPTQNSEVLQMHDITHLGKF